MIGYDKVYCWEESWKKFNTFGDPSYRRPPRAMETPRFSLETPRAFIIQDPKLLRNTKLIIRDPRISLKNRIFFHLNPQLLIGDSKLFIWDPRFSLTSHWRDYWGACYPCTPMSTSSLEMHPQGLIYYPKKSMKKEGYPQRMRLQRRVYRFILSVVFNF